MRYEVRNNVASVTLEVDDESVDLYAIGLYRDEPASLTAEEARDLGHQLLRAATALGDTRPRRRRDRSHCTSCGQAEMDGQHRRFCANSDCDLYDPTSGQR